MTVKFTSIAIIPMDALYCFTKEESKLIRQKDGFGVLGMSHI